MENEECLIRIKLLIEKYFEKIGRDEYGDTEEMRINLIDNIDEIVDKAKLDNKSKILIKLDMENNG